MGKTLGIFAIVLLAFAGAFTGRLVAGYYISQQVDILDARINRVEAELDLCKSGTPMPDIVGE